MEFPHLMRLMEQNAVRHDLPRALFLLLLHHRRPGVRGARPGAVRRRGTPDARRLAADLRAACRGRRPPRSRPPCRRCFRGKRTPGSTALEHYLRLRRAGRGGQARAAAVPDRRAPARASGSPGYGAAAKGNTLLNYCGVRARSSSTTSWTAARTSRASFLPGTHMPDRAARTASRRPGRTTC